MPVSLYFNHCLLKYKDMVGKDCISLMCSLSHCLDLEASRPLDFYKVILSHPDVDFPIALEGNKLLVDLTNVNKKEKVELSFSSKEEGLEEYKLTLYLFPCRKEESFIGHYISSEDKKKDLLLLEDRSGKMHLEDYSDELLDITINKWSFDPYSQSLRLEVEKKVNDEEVEFSFYLSVRLLADKEDLLVNLFIEAYKDGLSDHYYYIGDGDEDGITDYTLYKKEN